MARPKTFARSQHGGNHERFEQNHCPIHPLSTTTNPASAGEKPIPHTERGRAHEAHNPNKERHARAI